MAERIVLSIVSVAMFVFIMRSGGYYYGKIIVGGLTFGILLSWIGAPIMRTVGFYTFTLFSLLTVIYAFTQKHLTGFEKIIIGVIGIAVFIYNIFAIMNWPYASEMKLIMLVPLIAYIILLVRTKWEFKPVTAITTILAIDCLFKFSRLWFHN